MTNNELLTPNQIIKTKRKSISLVIKDNGDFIIRAPLLVQESDIFKFIKQKEKWIIQKRTEQLSNTINPITFNGEEEIYLLGKPYKLIYKDISKVQIDENQIIISKRNPKEKLISFLKKFAQNHLKERVELISNMFGFNYASISISSAKTCWGSCSFSNKLHLNLVLNLK